jgi:hypothetical protein
MTNGTESSCIYTEPNLLKVRYRWRAATLFGISLYIKIRLTTRVPFPNFPKNSVHGFLRSKPNFLTCYLADLSKYFTSLNDTNLK